MDIRIDLVDLGAQQMWELFQKSLPSLSPEERARRAKELGAEPLCVENAAERLFKTGLATFWKEKSVQGESRFALLVESDFLTLRSRLAKLCVDTVTLLDAKLLEIGHSKGADGPEVKEWEKFTEGAHMVIGIVDRLLQMTMGDTEPAKPPAPAAAKPGKPKKRKGKR